MKEGWKERGKNGGEEAEGEVSTSSPEIPLMVNL